MNLAWQDRAACQNDPDPECWFPVSRSSYDNARRERAVRVCLGCPVRSECLEYHLSLEADTRETFGVAGALTATERRKILVTS